MLKLKITPAEYGDCLWVEYGNPVSPRRILIDAGLATVYNNYLKPELSKLTKADRQNFELLVCTHIDADHIGGVLKLIEESNITGFKAKQVWFNGFQHLPDEAPGTLGPVQGEKLTELLLKQRWNWNAAFNGNSVMVGPEGELPRIRLDGGLILTLLSPNSDKLTQLKPVWEQVCRKAGLDPNSSDANSTNETTEGTKLLSGSSPDIDSLADEKFLPDNSKANGSSIAFMLEFEGHNILLAGDAHSDLLLATLKRWSPNSKPSFDVFKLPHHGSSANISSALVKNVDCKSWVFSTNGKKFEHPDQQAIARIIKYSASPQLIFNYRTQQNILWDNRLLRKQYGYTTLYPPVGTEGIEINFD